MIIQGLLSALYSVFSTLSNVINIPSLPDRFSEVLETFFTYVSNGINIIANYVDLPYLLILFGICVSVDVGIRAYHFIMWVIKKIPFIDVK